MSHNQTDVPGPRDGVLLCGLDGTNPLGFLAALGTLQTLTEADRTKTITLAWQRYDCSWAPLIRGMGSEKGAIAGAIAQYLKCPFRPDKRMNQKRERRQRSHDDKKRELKDALDSLKKRKLRGEERAAAVKKEIDPIRARLAKRRLLWLRTLQRAVPSPEIALGKHLNASCGELRETTLASLKEVAGPDRVALDLLAAFGSDACSQPKGGQMQATPFCFITGSGHQYFLNTVRQIMEQVDARRLEEALFSRSEPSDETLSMRWDPQEDRRYAVMWSDPTASDNKPTTNWAMNLLGYRGLQLCPSAPTSKELLTTGWLSDSGPAWRWPIWQHRLSVDIVRSLLSHPLLMSKKPSRGLLYEIGVLALYQASRVQVGKYINFSPAQQIA